MHLRSEQIYEALLDDEAMAELPDLLARHYDARSCVLHWWHPDGEAEVVAHNGYYPDAEMANYAANFTETDLWSIRGAKTENIVQNCDELVSPAEYERSEFYNEWIRAMGDDTFHCLGACIRTNWGMGFIGLHRGRTQGSFADESGRALGRDIVDLRRMLAIRGRLARAERRSTDARAALDRLGDAFFTVTPEGKIVQLNRAAETLLERSDGLAVRGQRLVASSAGADRDLVAAIALAADPISPSAGAVAIPRRRGRRLDVTVVPLTGQPHRHVMVTVRDPEAGDATLLDRLRSLYGLSPAEAEIAAALSAGMAPAAIADERRITVATVRSQIKTVAAKMGCTRQVEIAAVVTSLVRLQLD